MAPNRTLLGVYVDKEVHQRLKEKCEVGGVTLSFVVDQLIRRFLSWPGIEVRLLKTQEEAQDKQPRSAPASGTPRSRRAGMEDPEERGHRSRRQIAHGGQRSEAGSLNLRLASSCQRASSADGASAVLRKPTYNPSPPTTPSAPQSDRIGSLQPATISLCTLTAVTLLADHA
jgi:hypothetical protein